MMKDMYATNCGSHLAWNESDTSYNSCTLELAKSSPQIIDTICEIQEVAKRGQEKPRIFERTKTF